MWSAVAIVEFRALDPWANVALFVVAGCTVWFSGARLSRYADVIADRSGMGEAFTGLLLLGGATSLPELATTLSAAWNGAAELATSNLLGGVAMQTALLAVADGFVVRGALTFFTPRAVLLVQAILLVGLLALVLVAAAAGELLTLGHVGVWSIVIGIAYLGGLYLVHRYERQQAWEPVNPPEERDDANKMREHLRAAFESTSGIGLGARFACVAAMVAGAGWLVAETADAISLQAGLEASLVGATLVGLSTSLPELSTTISAVRLGAYSMAVSNIFGGNAIDVALLCPADLALREGPILLSINGATTFLAALGILLSCVYLWGLLERRDRSVLRLGLDSAVVAILYAGGLVVLYRMTQGAGDA